MQNPGAPNEWCTHVLSHLMLWKQPYLRYVFFFLIHLSFFFKTSFHELESSDEVYGSKNSKNNEVVRIT